MSDKKLIEQVESSLLEIMNKNSKKFKEIIESSMKIYTDKCQKDSFGNTQEKISILLDGQSPQDYFFCFEMVNEWINQCIDDIRNNLKAITYPLYVYMFLEMIMHNFWTEGKEFLDKYAEHFVSFRDEVAQLALLKEPLNRSNQLVNNYLRNKAHLFIPKITFDFLIHYLNTNNCILILSILNKYFERSNLLSKLSGTEEKNRFVLLNLTGEEVEKINSKQIYYSKINKDMDSNVTGKNKAKSKSEKATLSKVMIPIPDAYFDNLPLDETSVKIDKANLPTIGCFTILNSHNRMNCADITIDGSIVCCGFKDGKVVVWIMDPEMDLKINDELIKYLEEFKENNYTKKKKKKKKKN